MRGRTCRHACLALAGAVFLALGSPAAAAQGALPGDTQAPPGFQGLVQAAQSEGALVVMGVLRRWANYGEIFDTFSERYGIGIRQLQFDATTPEQMDAIRDNTGGQGSPSMAPDVVLGAMAYGPALKASGLVAPYKAGTWESIPGAFKDPDGYWVGGYYGSLVFEVNTEVVQAPPGDWEDLLKPEYQGMFALGGNPARGSLEALTALSAAGQATGAGLGDLRSGLEFFQRLNEAGNLLPIIGFWGPLVSGDSPIVAGWDFNALHDQDHYGPVVGAVVPASGLVAGVYTMGISTYAQHPNAARLFEEFLLSDEGQILLLKGHAHPIRLDDLVQRQVVSNELLGSLLAVPPGVETCFPTGEELEAARIAGEDQWAAVVGEVR